MRGLTVHVNVPLKDQPEISRVAGMLDDRRSVAVATLPLGQTVAAVELEFDLGDAMRLCDRCLSGDARALTTPGLARILSATAALLFRVSVAAGAIETEEPDDGNCELDAIDRDETQGDEDPGG